MRIALVEPYFGGSHRAFAEGYRSTSRHDVTLFTLPASFWKWRMHGGHVTLARRFEDAVASEGRYDLVLATSMLDVARFAGEARRAVGDTPVAVYMHENQLTYPTPPGDEFDMSYAMTNWTSMTAADVVLFNSDFHEREWFGSIEAFLRRLPDQRHTHLVADVAKKSTVVPVGAHLLRLDDLPRVRRERPLILWNHRWEHDKGPDRFTESLLALNPALEFEVALAGEQFVSDPDGFLALQEALGERVVHYGYADDADYARLLRSADVWVSAARQEFFGVSLTEAVYAGAFPLAPHRLVYPERLPDLHHGRCLYADRADLSAKLTWALRHRDEAALISADMKPAMSRFDWSVVAPQMDAVLESVVAGRES